NQETLDKEIVPRINPPEGQGALGVSLALTGVVSYPWYEAIWRGVYDAVILTMNTIIGYFMLFKTLLLKGKLIADVSGPIGIATITGQAARMGINYLMQFTAMISINLAVLNIIPFPALDGGRALLIIIEKLKGSPVNKKAEQLVNTIGFAFLIALMVYVTAKDILRFF
ncbi:MAG: site-2 protease family protein, partial [Patescibacteria group bacterium]